MRTSFRFLAITGLLTSACGMEDPLQPLAEPEPTVAREYTVEYRAECGRCNIEWGRNTAAGTEQIQGNLRRPQIAQNGDRLVLRMSRVDLRQMSGAIYINGKLAVQARMPEGKSGNIGLEFDLGEKLPWE